MIDKLELYTIEYVTKVAAIDFLRYLLVQVICKLEFLCCAEKKRLLL